MKKHLQIRPTNGLFILFSGALLLFLVAIHIGDQLVSKHTRKQILGTFIAQIKPEGEEAGGVNQPVEDPHREGIIGADPTPAPTSRPAPTSTPFPTQSSSAPLSPTPLPSAPPVVTPPPNIPVTIGEPILIPSKDGTQVIDVSKETVAVRLETQGDNVVVQAQLYYSPQIIPSSTLAPDAEVSEQQSTGGIVQNIQERTGLSRFFSGGSSNSNSSTTTLDTSAPEQQSSGGIVQNIQERTGLSRFFSGGSSNSNSSKTVIQIEKPPIQTPHSTVELNEEAYDAIAYWLWLNQLAVRPVGDGSFTIQHRDGIAQTTCSILINLPRNELGTGGECPISRIAYYPDRARDFAIDNRVMTEVVGLLDLTHPIEQKGKLVYEMAGFSHQLFLAFVPLPLPRTVCISAETLEIACIRQPLWSKILDMVSVSI